MTLVSLNRKFRVVTVTSMFFLLMLVYFMPTVFSISTSDSESYSINNSLSNDNEIRALDFETSAYESMEPRYSTENHDDFDYIPLGSRNILKWSYPTLEGSYISTPALVDLDLDGDLEIVFLTDAEAVYALTNDGTFIWKNTDYTISRADQFMTGTGSGSYYRPPFFSSITPADITDDNKPELFFGAKDKVVCLDSDGKEVWTGGDVNGDYISTPVVTDLQGLNNTNKSNQKIVMIKDVGHTEMHPQIFSNSGVTLETLERPSSWTNLGFGSVAALDLDGSNVPDAQKDLIFGNRYFPIRLYSNTSESYDLVSMGGFVSGLIYGTGAVGNFLGDNECEYFIGSYEGTTGLQNPSNSRGVYYLYDPINDTGSDEEHFRIWYRDSLGSGTGFLGSPAVGDVHGGIPNPTTGKVGYEGFLGSYNGRLYCIDLNTGNILWSFNTGAPLFSSPALCNINSDASLEVIVASNNGIIYCLDGDPSDNKDEGISDSGGTNYDILWQYDTGGNGTWVSSPVVADIDNDKNLEVVVGDIDGNVWCLNAGPVNISGQIDWPMFQHDTQNTGVLPTRSTSFKISFELLNGDGENNQECYTQYRPYNFRITIEDGMGFIDLDDVILSIDPMGKDIQCKWSRKTDTFTVVNNPSNTIELISTSLDSSTDYSNTWILDFIIIFDWSFDDNRPFGCSVKANGQVNPTRSIYYADFVAVENNLEFIGDLIVTGEHQGPLATGAWVRGEEQVFWSNLTVVYGDTTDIYPDVSKYKVIITDDKDNLWEYNPSTPGEILEIPIKLPAVTDPGREFLLNLVTIPETSGWSGHAQEFNLRIDNTPPTPPGQVLIHADSYTDSNIMADNDKHVFITWTTPSQEYSGISGYYYSTIDNGGTKSGTFTTANSAEVTVEQAGEFFVYVWAIDTVGNIGSANIASIIIDMEEITFSSYQPDTSEWFNFSTIPLGVTISDSNGIGVDPASIQYSIKSEEAEDYGVWLSINQDTDITWITPTKASVNSMITFTDRGVNYLRWRASDLAGNGYTISSEVQLLVDDLLPIFENPNYEKTTIQDFRWVKCNITIIDFGGSGINASSIDFKYSNNGLTNYTDWINTKLRMDSLTLSVETTLFFNFGKNNYIKWRAKDVAGSGYIESKDIQIFVNSPPVIDISSPTNNSKLFIDDVIDFDSQGTFDIDDDALSYYWVNTYTTNVGLSKTESIGYSSLFQRRLQTGSNSITIYVNDGSYNISKTVYVFGYDQYTDLDKDGMPDWWEEQYYGLDPESPADSTTDLDGDGINNLQEYLDKTNPADEEDYIGKKDSADDDSTNQYYLINIMILIIVIIILIVFFVTKRSRMKKAQFKKMRESRPAMLLRRDATERTELRTSGVPQVIPSSVGATPQLAAAGAGAAPSQEVMPQLPPHLPKATDATTTKSEPDQQPGAQPPPQTQTQDQPQTTISPTIGTTPPENSNSTKEGGGNQ